MEVAALIISNNGGGLEYTNGCYILYFTMEKSYK